MSCRRLSRQHVHRTPQQAPAGAAAPWSPPTRPSTTTGRPRAGPAAGLRLSCGGRCDRAGRGRGPRGRKTRWPSPGPAARPLRPVWADRRYAVRQSQISDLPASGRATRDAEAQPMSPHRYASGDRCLLAHVASACDPRVTLLPGTTSGLAACGGRGRGSARRAACVRSRPVRGSVVRRMPGAVPLLPARGEPSRLPAGRARSGRLLHRAAAPRVRGLRLLRAHPGPGRPFHAGPVAVRRRGMPGDHARRPGLGRQPPGDHRGHAGAAGRGAAGLGERPADQRGAVGLPRQPRRRRRGTGRPPGRAPGPRAGAGRQ